MKREEYNPLEISGILGLSKWTIKDWDKTRLPRIIARINEFKKRSWHRNQFRLLKEIAYFIGKITGDGNLDNKFTIRFISGKRIDLITLRKIIMNKLRIPKNKFSSIIKRQNNGGKSYLLQINDALLGRLVYGLGAPRGNKTKICFNIPKWIIKKKIYSKFYLQGLLEDELTTIKFRKDRKNKFTNIMLKMAKIKRLMPTHIKFLNNIKFIIERFGINCSSVSTVRTNIYQNNTESAYFRILPNKENILKYRDQIGFRVNQNKIRNLNICCKYVL